jgi:LPS-assembly lipoprotein
MAAAPRGRAAGLPARPASRRSALRASATVLCSAALAGLGAPLAGCGFRLRTAPPLAFERLHLAGFAPRSPLEAALRRALADRVRLVDTPAESDLMLKSLAEARERSVAASTAAGQVRELQLRLRVTLRADGPDGRERMAPVTLRQVRELRTTETAALAKSVEEELLYRAMLDDVVEQLLRRLAALRP